MTSNTASTSWWVITPHLRFIERDGKRILQQAWQKHFQWEAAVYPVQRPMKWRDVPFVESEAT